MKVPPCKSSHTSQAKIEKQNIYEGIKRQNTGDPQVGYRYMKEFRKRLEDGNNTLNISEKVLGKDQLITLVTIQKHTR